ncbi:hypothetical protein [Xanthomonas hortorum]|uniref:hypothetical protein n=1 Tax=Xanthomonas hortorum TaxID=56454 RepID=UPI0015D61701|nr:hypothetical protein [Xanthomonas hortorum]MCE4360685.1 hypothetical protein [Xanthomonas hortorum pv. taraxaci]NMI54129.1 hypothetical protein [Xanthomonas hortorum pv. taraxaci]CAD0318659.1 hypothetical protein NCPPB940_14900 [Xanthomonas hortorum pv. taraxaci]CAD0318670.1 hypothetical protein NCPPB940_14900 [Xanthomonas hortorum pv. taraxaci]
MKTPLLTLLVVVAAGVCAPASAQLVDSKRLHAAATGPTIAAGRTSFRLIPGAVVRLADSAPAPTAARAVPASQTATDVPVARFDRYAIYLDAGTAARTDAAVPAGRAPRVAAALETHSGQLVLLGASIKLFDTTPAIARALATRTGGKLIYASAIDGSAMIGYDSVATALNNCTQLQGSKGVGAIKPEVIPRTARPL